MDQLEPLNFRSAGPEDIYALSLLHQKTLKNSLGASIGIRYSKAFFKWFVTNKNTVTLVCCNSKQIIGYVIGGPEGYSNNLTKSILPEIISGLILHPKSLLHPNFLSLLKSRIKNLFEINLNLFNSNKTSTCTNKKNTTFVLVGIGVDQEFRGNQIGFQILQEYEKLVWELNYTKIRLTVYKSNYTAIRLYKKSNWSLSNQDGNKLTYLKKYQDNNGG
tara:strand:- start:20 stop:673 length:654 start_codon:yes stop_codon:yes gene_type:complete